mmetsp:Transcript_99778/g.253700  ORF Transcript_99778/g.253700 Transcript_99778/m.253700 type:complete len:179 (+) Transcript_99778:76-612(+)
MQAVGAAYRAKFAPGPTDLNPDDDDFEFAMANKPAPAPKAGVVLVDITDLPAEPVADEELQRRLITPSEQMKKERWYKNGAEVFVAKCAGCHGQGGNSAKVDHTLFNDDLTRNGVNDPDKIRQIIRYGAGTMPGFSKDCSSKVDYTQCGVLTPLSEQTLQDLQIFIANRANFNWKGRG